jgi:hypothetical protein
MLDKETRERIADYFDAADLVDFLQIKTSDIVDAFEVEIEDNLEDIEEMIGVRKKNER